jgi:hypothetical protein
LCLSPFWITHRHHLQEPQANRHRVGGFGEEAIIQRLLLRIGG